MGHPRTSAVQHPQGTPSHGAGNNTDDDFEYLSPRHRTLQQVRTNLFPGVDNGYSHHNNQSSRRAATATTQTGVQEDREEWQHDAESRDGESWGNEIQPPYHRRRSEEEESLDREGGTGEEAAGGVTSGGVAQGGLGRGLASIRPDNELLVKTLLEQLQRVLEDAPQPIVVARPASESVLVRTAVHEDSMRVGDGEIGTYSQGSD